MQPLPLLLSPMSLLPPPPPPPPLLLACRTTLRCPINGCCTWPVLHPSWASPSEAPSPLGPPSPQHNLWAALPRQSPEHRMNDQRSFATTNIVSLAGGRRVLALGGLLTGNASNRRKDTCAALPFAVQTEQLLHAFTQPGHLHLHVVQAAPWSRCWCPPFGSRSSCWAARRVRLPGMVDWNWV